MIKLKQKAKAIMRKHFIILANPLVFVLYSLMIIDVTTPFAVRRWMWVGRSPYTHYEGFEIIKGKKCFYVKHDNMYINMWLGGKEFLNPYDSLPVVDSEQATYLIERYLRQMK